MPKDFSHINLREFPHSTPIQIRFVDVDRVGHVNNATIITYFETARVFFLNEVVGERNDWSSMSLILAHTEVDYLIPVYLEDTVKVYSKVLKVGTKSFEMENVLVKVEHEKELIAAYAKFVLVCMDYKAQKTIEIPSDWREKLVG
jgi:acyl-CoA thioester hydrolase